MEDEFTTAPEKNRLPRWLLITLLCLAAGAVIAFFALRRNAALENAAVTPEPAAVPTVDANFQGLTVYFLDVGQGDCAFLRSPSGKTMLVDAGPEGSFGKIRRFLQQQNVEKLDMVVATHLHGDHIGSMEEIVDSFDVGSFYVTPFDSTESSTYASLLAALDAHGVTPVSVYAEGNTTLPWDDWAEVRVLAPYDVQYDTENNTSLVLRVSYLHTAVLLAGDAEALSERLMVKAMKNHLLKANVLKVGHHGSSTGTTKKFLNAVKPQYAVISVGKDNGYGLPDEKTVNRLIQAGAQVYRTDEDGTVGFALDGTHAWVLE